MNYSIAFDGPSAGGKSTIAKMLATKYGFLYVDTGAMYRAFTLGVINAGLDPKNEEISNSLIGKIKIWFNEKNHVTLDGVDVDERVREPDIADNVSYIATYKQIRLHLVDIQRALASNRSIVMDGRDIGTYVLPNASLKIYQIADVKVRATRRYLQNLEKGINSTYEDCLANLEKRDYIDSHRAFAPAVAAEDAIQLDTTYMTINEVLNKIEELMAERGIK